MSSPLPVPPDDNTDPAWERAVKAMRMGNPNPMIGYHLRPDDPYVQAFQSRHGRPPTFEESQHEIGRRYDALTSPGVPAIDRPTSGLRDPYLRDTPTPAERDVLRTESEADLRSLSPLEAAKRYGQRLVSTAVGMVRYPLDLLGAETRKIMGPTPAERANQLGAPPTEPSQAEILSGLSPVEQVRALGKEDPFSALGSIAGMGVGGELLHAPFEAARVLDARRAAGPRVAPDAPAATLKTPAGEGAPVAAPTPLPETPALPRRTIIKPREAALAEAEAAITPGATPAVPPPELSVRTGSRGEPGVGASGLERLNRPPEPDLETPTFERRGGAILPPLNFHTAEPIIRLREAEPAARAVPSVDQTNLEVPTYLRNLAPEQLHAAFRGDPGFWRSERGTALLAGMAATGVAVPGSILGAISDPDNRKRGAATGVLMSLLLAGGVAVGGREMLERAPDLTRYAKLDDAALQARHFEVFDRLQRAAQDAGEGIQPWTRFDDDEHVMRSGTAVSGKAGRAIGRAKDDARILSEIEAEFARRGVSPDELLDRYMTRAEREGVQAEGVAPGAPHDQAAVQAGLFGDKTLAGKEQSELLSETAGVPTARLKSEPIAPSEMGRVRREGTEPAGERPAALEGFMGTGRESIPPDELARTRVIGRAGAPPEPPVKPPAPPTPPEPPSGPPGGGEPPRSSRLNLPTNIVSPEYEARVRAKFPASVAEDVATRAAQVVQEQGLNPNRPVTWAETQAAANQLALNPSDVSQLRALKLSAPELKATVDVVNRDAKALAALHEQIAAATDETTASRLRAQAETLEQRIADGESVLMRASSQKGRDLNILRKMAQDTRDPAAWLAKATRMKERPLTDTERAEILNRLSKGDQRGLATYVQGLKYGTTYQGLVHPWIANLISSPLIYGKALAGSVTLTGMELGSKAVQAGLDRIAAAAMGTERQSAFTGSMLTATAKGYKVGMEEGFKKLGVPAAAATGAALGAATGYAQHKDPWEAAEGALIGAIGLGAAGPILKKLPPHFAGDLPEGVSPFDRPSLRYENPMLSAVNRYYADVVGNTHGVYMAAAKYSGYLRSIAEQMAVAKLNGLPVKEPTGEMMVRAAEYAAEMSLTSREGPVAARAIALKRAVGAPLLPIAVVPANAIEWLGRYTGTLDGMHQRFGRVSRATTGAGLIAFGYWLASQGKMTGAAPDNPKERETFYAMGKKPWSVLGTNGEWRGLGAVAPAGMLVGIGAELHRIVSDEALTPEAKAEAAAFVLPRIVAQQPFVQGPVHAAEAITQGPSGAAQREVSDLATSVVPGASFLRHTAMAADTLQRQPVGVKENVEAEIPGLRERVLPRQGMFGEPLKRGGSPTQALFDFTQPSRARTETNPVFKELERIGASPAQPQKIAGETPQEYYRRNREGGKDAFELVKRVMNSPMYRGAETIARNVYRNPAAIAKYPELGGMDLPAATRWLQKMMIEQAASAGRERVNYLTSGVKFLERLHQATDSSRTAAAAQ